LSDTDSRARLILRTVMMAALGWGKTSRSYRFMKA
jgi:hypothetical protein